MIAQTLQGALASGLALTGVLAVAGVAAARFGRTMPHLGVAALGAGAAVVAGRLATVPRVLTILALLGAAAAAGAAGWWVDRRAAVVSTHVWPPALLGDAAVLVVGLGIGALLRLPAAVELPLGVLGGVTSTVAALIAVVVGVGTAVALGTGLLDSLHEAALWVVASVSLAIAVSIGSGMLQISTTPALPAFGIPDVVGVAVRAVAVGVVARRGVWWGIGAAAVLGLGEAALRSVWSAGDLVLVVHLAVIVAGLRRVARPGIATA